MKLDEFNRDGFESTNAITKDQVGFEVDYDSLTLPHARKIKKFVESYIIKIKKTSEYHLISENKTFLSFLLIRDGINDWIDQHARDKSHHKISESARQLILEDEVGKSETILAAKDLVDSIQKMVQDTGKLQNEQTPALVDAIRSQFDNDHADAFSRPVNKMLGDLLVTLQKIRGEMDICARSLMDNSISPDVRAYDDAPHMRVSAEDDDEEDDNSDKHDKHNGEEGTNDHKPALDDFALTGNNGGGMFGREEKKKSVHTESVHFDKNEIDVQHDKSLVERYVVLAIRYFMHEGHIEVNTNVFLNKIIGYLGTALMLKDLVRMNRHSHRIQKLLSSIDINKVKFNVDALSVNNKKPKTDKGDRNPVITKMAERRRNKHRRPA